MIEKDSFHLKAMVLSKDVRYKGTLELSLELVLTLYIKEAEPPVMEKTVSPEVYHSVEIGDIMEMQFAENQDYDDVFVF
jgi:hypothetical protein